MKVCRCCPARAHHDSRTTRGKSRPERSEGRAPLVVEDVDCERCALVLCSHERQRQGSGPRARSDESVAHALSDPLVHESIAETRLDILGTPLSLRLRGLNHDLDDTGEICRVGDLG